MRFSRRTTLFQVNINNLTWTERQIEKLEAGTSLQK